MKEQEALKLIQGGESITVEFKRCGNGVCSDTFETVCSFLNRYGGHLFLGVGDHGEILGIPENSAFDYCNRIVNTLNDQNLFYPRFYLLPEVLTLQGRTVIHLQIPCGMEAYRYKGNFYDRAGDGDIKLLASEPIMAMFLRKEALHTETQVVEGLELADLQCELIKKCRMRAINNHGGRHPWEELDDLELLKSAGLYGFDRMTGKEGFVKAAVLLLGKDDVIQEIFPEFRTEALLRRNDLERYDDRLTVTTNLLDGFDQLFAFGEKYLPDRFFLEDIQRVNVRNVILREIISNILMHREYANPKPGLLEIGNDAIRTENPSCARRQGALTLDNLVPLSKNPLIAAFFRQIGLAETLGTGMRKLFKYVPCYAGGKVAPQVEEGDVFRVTIPLQQTFPQHVAAVHETLACYNAPSRNNTQERILLEIAADPKISAQRLAERIGVSPRTVQTHIRQLKADGRLARTGANKNGQWHLL